MAAIDLRQCLQVLESGEWVSMEVLTANINKGTGGRLMVIPKCRIARNQHAPTGARAAKLIKENGKNPNARENFTRNVEFPNHDIITIHPIIIYSINNQRIL